MSTIGPQCYRCGSSGDDLRCCSSCHKWMCDRCRSNWLMRSMDAAYEKVFGYSKDWYRAGQC